MERLSHYPFWTSTKDEMLALLHSSDEGLSSAEAAERKLQYGINSLKADTTAGAWMLFLLQFKTPVTLLLIGAALLSLLLGDKTDAYIIFAIVLISGMLGFWQEKGAANAMKQLLKMIRATTVVKRNGQEQEVPAEEIVPGDIVLLSAGSLIPADSILLESNALFIDEAAFTGESFPVEKSPGTVAQDAPLSKRTNCLFMGSHVISGKAVALAVVTGRHSALGKISASLQSRIPETSFERGIRKLGYLLMEITLLLVFVIFAVNVYLHKPVLDSFLFSLALAVGLTPQLLPAIISVNLARGAKKMAKNKVIVKRLSSIQNLGSMTTLCSDKTGTLTEGKVSVLDTLDADGLHSGKVLYYAWLNASLQQGFRNPIDEALCACKPANTGNAYAVQSEVPYDFVRKRLSVQVCNEQENLVITKGAVKQVLAICTTVMLSGERIVPLEKQIAAIHRVYKQYSENGYRVLGVAHKKIRDGKNFTKEDEIGMCFTGFIVLFDPVKENAIAAITQLKQLGVSLKLITGDNALVASNIARQIGWSNPVVLTGSAMWEMSTAALMHQVVHTDVFAEVEPSQKERIIMSLKKRGEVTGFLGDGINDASAMHVADVGISVNSAVDVAKEAADIILLEKDLNVLATGVKEGRCTFANTMKYIFMATSANFGNMFSMAGASLFLPFLPLLPKQILLVNLLTDLPEMTISTDRVDPGNINSPGQWDVHFIKRFMIVFGLLSSIFDYCTFALLLLLLKSDERVFQTGWFTESVVSASLIVLVVRTRLPFFKSLPGKYLMTATAITVLLTYVFPWSPLGALLGFSPLPLYCHAPLLGIIFFYIISAELLKRWFYRRVYKNAPGSVTQ